jgi:hypothetical protein
MDQPCYKCGQTVEEGVAFCPHCSAPQIRVVLSEAPPPAVALSTQSGAAALSDAPPPPPVMLALRWSAAFRPCALAALVASALMALGLNPFVAMLSAGFLAVLFYRQRWPGSAIKALTGVRLGALSGLLWFAISSILEAVVVLFLHKGPEIRDELVKRINQTAAQTADPQVLAVFDRFRTPGGLELLMIFGLIFAFVASLVLGIIGGALGGNILGRGGKN